VPVRVPVPVRVLASPAVIARRLRRVGDRDALERDVPEQQLIPCPPHDAETAGAELLEQPVAAEQQRISRSRLLV